MYQSVTGINQHFTTSPAIHEQTNGFELQISETKTIAYTC